MTAQENLNEQQFMAIADIGRMKSVNRTAQGGTVDDWDVIYRSPKGAAIHTNGWGGMDKDVARHGVEEPLEVGIAHDPARHVSVLYDGHHRYSAAKKAGLTHVPVTTEESWSPK